jgi:hypothetical protein
MAGFTVTANVSSLQEALQADAKTLTAAMRTVIRRTGTLVRNRLQKVTVSAGLGRRLAGRWKREFTERKGPVPDMESRVFPSAPLKRAGGKIDLLAVFAEGAIIKVSGRHVMTIPTDKVGRKGNRRLTPRDFPRDFFALVPAKGGRIVLFIPRKHPEEGAYFIGVKQARIRKRFDVDSTVKPAVSDLEGKILRDFALKQVKQAQRQDKAA